MRFKVSWKHIIFSPTMCMLCPGKSYFVSNRYLKKLMNCKAYTSIIRHGETDIQRQTCTDRDRQTAMETDRQTDTQMDRQMGRQADRKVDTQTGRQIDRDRETGRQPWKWMDGQTGGLAGGQAGRLTHRHTHRWSDGEEVTKRQRKSSFTLSHLMILLSSQSPVFHNTHV